MSDLRETKPPADEAPPADRRYTVCTDFDGVLYSYTSGWLGPDVLPDPPVPGAIEWLREVAAEYEVVVLTTRGATLEGCIAVQEWLARHGYDDEIAVTCKKPPALFYLDDRGWRFNGRFPAMRVIRHVKPWRVGDDLPKTGREYRADITKAYRNLEAKQAQLKRWLVEARTELIRVLLDLDDEGFEEWWREHEKLPWEKRIAAAREYAAEDAVA